QNIELTKNPACQQFYYKDFTIQTYEEVESTNNIAFQLAKAGFIKHNHIIQAESQSCGKGRYGRNWHSPKGNLYFSLLLKPDTSSYLLSFVAAVAMGMAIEELCENQAI